MNVQKLVSKIADEANEGVGEVGKIFRRTMIKLAAYPIAEVEELLAEYRGLDESEDPPEAKTLSEVFKEEDKKKGKKKRRKKTSPEPGVEDMG